MPNICFEAIASVWLHTKKQIMKEPVEQQIMESQESLENTRKNIEMRERELLNTITKLAKEAVTRKKHGDVVGARSKMQERARAMKDQKKMQDMLTTIETQLDAIKTCELEKEIMKSLKASSTALKKAGIGVNMNDVENVMSELDDHIKEIQEKTTVLTNPINNMYEDDDELESELNSLLDNDDEYDRATSETTPLTFQNSFDAKQRVAYEVASNTQSRVPGSVVVKTNARAVEMALE